MNVLRFLDNKDAQPQKWQIDPAKLQPLGILDGCKLIHDPATGMIAELMESRLSGKFMGLIGCTDAAYLGFALVGKSGKLYTEAAVRLWAAERMTP